MKKYFKLGTALAFSVLLNLTPTLITNVNAEEQTNNTSIVENTNNKEIYYANQINFDDSSLIEEEPLEVKKSTNEVSTAEANNIEVSEPARAPTNEKSDEENNEDIEITNDNNDEVISVKAESDRIQTEAPIITVKSSDSALSGTTTIENRTDAVLYNPKYKFTIDNYIGNLRIKIIDTLPYTVTQESINALNGELNGKTLTWYVDLGNFNTYDEEGNSNPLVIDNISNPIDFSLKYSNIPLNVTRFNNTIKLRVEYRYIKDGEEIIEEQPIIVNSSNKETTKYLYTSVKTVNEETKNIELTVDKETATTSVAENGTDIITEPITYNVKYNFDATNYNGNTKATVTVTLPGEIDIEAPGTNIPKDGKYNGTSSTKTIVWTQDIPANGERCTSEGICETENISDEFSFTVVYKNPTKALNVSARANIQTPSGNSNASTNTDTVTTLTNVGAKINFHFVNQEGQAIENAPNYSIDANLGDKLTMASYKKSEEMESLHYEYDKACRLSGENCTTVATLTVDNTNIDINMIYKSQKFVTINYKDSNGNLVESLSIPNPDKKYFNNNTSVYFDSIREEVEDDGYYHVETKLNGTKTTAKYFKITSDDNIVDFIIEKYRLVTINYLGEDGSPLTLEGTSTKSIKVKNNGTVPTEDRISLEPDYYINEYRLNGESVAANVKITELENTYDIIYYKKRIVTLNYVDEEGNAISGIEPKIYKYTKNQNLSLTTSTNKLDLNTIKYSYLETCMVNGDECTKIDSTSLAITEDTTINYVYAKYRKVRINYLGEDEQPLNIEGIVPVEIEIRKGGQISSQYIPNLENEYYVNGYRLNGENVSYTVSIQEKENIFDVIYYKRRLITLNYLDEYNNPIEGVEVKTYNYKKDTSLSLTSTTNKKDLKNIKYSYLETCIVNGNECVKTTESSIIITEDTIINYIYAKYRNVTINYKDRHGNPIEGVDPVTTELKKFDKVYRSTYNKDLSENSYYLGDVVVNGVVNNNNMITIEEEEYVIDYLYEKRTNNNIIHVTTHVENYEDPYSEIDQTYNKEVRSSTVSSYIRTADILGIENIIIRVDDQTYYATKIEDDSEELDYGTYDNPNFYYLEEQNYTSMYYNPRFINEHEDIDVDFYYAFTDKEHDYNVIINYLFLDDDSILLARNTQEITNYYGMDWLEYLYNYTNFLQDRGLTKDESNNVLYYEREVFNYKAEELVDRRYKYPNITGYLDGFGSMQVDLGVMVDGIGILPIQHSTGIELNPAELDIDENGYNFGNKLYGNMPHSDINIVLLFGKASVINVKHIYLDNGAERILKEEFYDDSKLPLEKNYITTNVIEDPNIKYIGYKDEYDAQWQDNHKLEELGEEDISWKETEIHPSNGEKSYKIAYQQILFSKYTRYLYYETNIGQIKIHHIDTEGNHITVDKLGNNVTSLYEYTGEIGTSFEDKLGPIEIAGYQNMSTNATDFSNNYNYTKELIQIFYVYDVLKYNLDFVTNGGTSVESEVLEYNTPVTIGNYNTEKDYYYFDGWYKDEALTEKAEDFNITENTTLYAKWINPSDYPDTPETDWDVSKSKTATPLDENLQTEIEIALPSSKEELETTVVFVIDNSSSTVTDAIEEAQSIVDTLMDQVRNSGAKVNIAVVAFKGDAKVLTDLVVLSEDNIANVKDLIAQGYNVGSGSNVHAGLIEAEQLLDMSEIDSSRKYMILLTDGITRNFIGSDGEAKNIYYDFDNARYWGDMSSWSDVRGVPEGNYSVPGGDWNEYYQKVKTWVEQDQDTYVEEFIDYNGNGKPDSTFLKTYAPEDFVYIPRGDTEHAFAVDRAIYEAYEKYKAIEAKGYHLYSVQTKNYPLGKAFLEALNNGKILSFTDIKKDILYLVDKGTIVKDYIGEDFKFVNGDNPFTIKINDEELIATKVDENTYTFRKTEDEENTYRHKVTFHDVENGYIVWEINDTIDNFTRVKLLFKEELTNYSTEKLGTIPTDTNIVATITPVDSEGNEGETETFEKPVVEYTIGNVIANYVDEDNNTLAESKEYRGIVGIETYETKEETIPLYHLIDIKEESDVTGKYQNETITVTYVYAKDTGKVIIHYIDKNGETIHKDDTLEGPIGDPYNTNTSEEKIASHTEIISNGYDYLTSTGKVEGTFTSERPINVTYIYEKLGKVIVKFLDKDTNSPVAEEETMRGNVGESYNTSSKQVELYDLDSEPENKYGDYTVEDQEVIYYYVKQKGTVITHYVDIETNEEIAKQEIQSQKIGNDYTTTKINNIENYTFVSNTENITGQYTKDTIDVYYYYQKQSGDVIAIYVDAITGEKIADDYTDHGYVDVTYNTPEKEISGYELVRVEGQTSGNFKNGETIEVTYYYKESDKIGHVIIKYQDEDGNALTEDIPKQGIVGQEYSSEAKNFPGYQLVTIPELANSTYTEESVETPIIVIYQYQKEGKVVTHYVDTNGNDLANTTTQTGKIGDSYITTPKDIPNYELVGTPANKEGEYQREITHVIYVYDLPKEEEKPNCCNNCCNTCTGTNCTSCSNSCAPYLVITRYEDENGNTIAEENVEHVAENAQYTTTKKVIDGYEFIRVSEDSDPTEGTYIVPEEGEAQPIKVTYIYKELPKEEPTPEIKKEEGILVVRYVDENEARIADDVISSELEGTKYVTSQKVIDGYTFTSVTENYKGTYNNDIIEVIYRYKKNEIIPEEPVVEPKTSYVVVKYIDENRQEIAEKVILSGKVGEFYFTTQKQIDGYIFVEVDSEEEGNFTEEITRVTYSYKKIEEEPVIPPEVKETGILVVRYVDENEARIADDEISSAEEGTKYVTSQKVIDGYTYTSVTENYKGSYNNDIIEVIYSYKKNEVTPEEPVVEPKTSYVVVKYVDEKGKEVAEKEILSGKVGENYFTTQKQVSGYNYVSVDKEEEGNFTDEIIRVTYTYEKIVEEQPEPIVEPKEITILVQYVDQETGNPVFASDTLIGKEGSTYTTTRLPKEGYTLVTPEFEEIGEFRENTTLTYFYQKQTEEVIDDKATILVQYIDKSTNNPIYDSQVLTGKLNDIYIITRKAKDGYTIENPTFAEIGEYTTKLQVFTYYYEKIEEDQPEPVVDPKTSYVVVKYVDEDGQEIAEKEILSGKVGENYFTSQKQINGYKFVEVDNEEEGTFQDEIIRVTYTYNKIEEVQPEPVVEPKTSYVVVKYVDEEGLEIAEKEILPGKVGENYFTSQKQINGYKFVEVDNEEEGTFQDEIIRVTYTYNKIEEVQPEPVVEPKDITILVQYLDQETGNPVFDSTTLTGKEGTIYTITRKAKEGYTLVTPDFEELGEYKESKILTYYYEKEKIETQENPEIAYVLVHYIDENGNQIKNDIVVTGKVGENYVIPAEIIPGYNLINIEKVDNTPIVRLRMLKAAPSLAETKPNIGTYTAGVTEINFIYEKEVTETPDEPEPPKQAMLIVRYQDIEGTAIAEDTVTTGVEGDFYNANQKVIAGYKFVKVDSEETYGTLKAGQTVITYTYEKLPEEKPSSDGNNCGCNNTSCCCNNCGNNNENSNNNNPEDNKPIINIEVNINNENNSDNHSENNNDNTVDNHADNHNEDNSDNHTDVNVDNHSDNHTENNVNNDTNVDNHNDNTTDVNNDNHTDVNNENNNQDETNINIENNPTQTNENQNDSSINNNPVNTNENNNQSSSENSNDNSSSSSSDNENQNSSENNPINNNDGSNNNENTNNNTTSCTENCEKTCEDKSCEEKEPIVEQPPKKGLVVVNYLDQDGKQLAASTITMDEVEKEYITNQKDIPNYEFTNVEGNPIGKYEENVITVNYYYKKSAAEVIEQPKYGTVYTHYYDTKGNKIGNDKVQTLEVGKEYTTIKENFEGYNYLTAINNTTGTIIEGTIDVTYLYEIIPEEQPVIEPEKENGTVVVYYIDTKGNTLEEKEVIENEVGKTYLTDQKSFDEYDFVTVVGNKNGTIEKGIKEVIYIYEKKTSCEEDKCKEEPVCPEDKPCKPEEKTGKVVARYMDNNGNTLTEEIITEDKVGENYVTLQKEFDGYDFVTVAGNRSGKYVDGVVEVTYIYEPKKEEPVCPEDKPCKPEEKTGIVIIHYIDENGNTLLEDKQLQGKIDEPYKSTKEEIDNYTFVKVEGSETGTYQEESAEITYIYKRNKGKVISHYVDTEGNTIGYDITQEGYVEEDYSTKYRKFKGYTFVQVVGAYAGKYINGTIEVTYIYQKDDEGGSVPVKETETVQPREDTKIKSKNNSFHNSLKIPNTGIQKENNINILALIMTILGASGLAALKLSDDEEE